MKIKKKSQRAFYHQLALLGVIGFGSYACSQQAKAAELGSQSGADITLQNNDSIVADSTAGFAYGVLNDATGTVNLAQGVSIVVDAAANGVTVAKGIQMQANGSTLTANGLSVVVKGSGNTAGINVTGAAANIDLGTASSIRVEDGVGIYMNGASSISAEGIDIYTQGEFKHGVHIDQRAGASVNLGSGSRITTTGIAASGVYIDGSGTGDRATFTATNLFINTQGDDSTRIGANGVTVKENAYVNLGSNSTIQGSGSRTVGVFVDGGEFEADKLTIDNSASSYGEGIRVRNGGTVNVGAGSTITPGDGAYGLSSDGGSEATVLNFKGTANNRNVVSTNGSFAAQAFSDNAQINLAYTDVNLTNTLAGVSSTGLSASSGGVIKGDYLTINGADSSASSSGVSAFSGGRVELTGDTVLNMAHLSHNAIVSTDGADTLVSASGKLTINGRVMAGRSGQVSLDMQSDSVWNGAADNYSYSSAANVGTLNVAMAGSLWNVAGNSYLDALTMSNSTVDFSSDVAPTGAFTTLTMDSLSGSGTFVMRTDIVGDGYGDGVNNAGDLLKVTGTSAGSHLLTIKNQGSLATTGNEVLTVVETADGAATFAATSKVELGGYLYDVRKNGTNWELYSSGTEPDPTPTPDPTPSPDPTPTPDPTPDPKPSPSPVPTTAADAGGNYLNVGYLMNYAENQTLMQRMGDLRQSGERGNVWIRGYGGKFDAFASGKLSGFDMGYSGVQFGADKRISVETPLFIGLFIGSTHASPDYRGGDGTASSDYMGMYASYMAQGGFYSDLVLKASHQKNGFSVLDSQNNGVNADGSASGFSASLEAGQKFSLNPTGNGFYVEPQAQFTYSHQDAMGMRASNGLNIDLSSYESMLGRASVLLGYETTAGGSKVSVYLKTGALREFSGDTDYRLNGSKEKHCFKGNGWNNGLGISAQISGQHTLYLEADYTSGNAFEQRQVNGGYRFSF